MGIFLLSVFKSPIAQPSVRWVNTYQLSVDGATLPADVPTPIVGAFQFFESEFLLGSYQIVQTVLSTWVPDGTPYDPQTFITDPTVIDGGRALGGGIPLPLRDVLYVRRETEFGRAGKLMYRGCLVVADVTNTTGEWALKGDAGIRDIFEPSYTALDTALVANDCEMQLIIPSTGVGREVVDLAIAGVRSVSRNHRWFNHTA